MNARTIRRDHETWRRLPRRRVTRCSDRRVRSVPSSAGAGGEASASPPPVSRNCPTGQVCVHKTCTPKCDDPLICVNGTPTGRRTRRTPPASARGHRARASAY